MRSVKPTQRLIVALDVPDLAAARALLGQLAGEVEVFKVGLELFSAAGPDAVRAVHDAGAACFLDLKLHDIPATVARAVDAAEGLGVRYLTVHASNGPRGLTEARAHAETVRLLAVTVLTSMDDAELGAIGVAGTAADSVSRLARVAKGAGIDGLVCSAEECRALRAELGSDALLVVPGIRPAGAVAGDQKRVATPARAIADGADLLVVGRPIRDARDPVAAARAVIAEIAAPSGTEE
jgi:orotidine-5'-phosphate decarboxylase